MSGIPAPAVIPAGAGIHHAGRIVNIYPCNRIHEISLGYCEPNMVCKENRLYNTVSIILKIQVVTWICQDLDTVFIKTL